MREFQKISAYIMAVALAVTDCSGGSTNTKALAEPAKTGAAGETEMQTTGGEAAGEEDSILVVYTARSEALDNAVIPEFEKGTGIKVGAMVAGTGELPKRAQSEEDNPLGDIFWVADQAMFSASGDLFMEHVSSGDGSILEAFRDTAGYSTPAFADPTVMVINKDLKGDMKVDGFEGPLNPELKGKITFGDPVGSGPVFQSLPTMLYGMGRDGDPLSDQAWNYMGQFIANLGGKMCSSSSQVYKGVAEGGYVVGLTQGDPATNYAKEDAVVEVIFPGEGTIPPGESIQILKDCKHPENTKKFVDYMLSERIQNVVGSDLTVRPLREDAKLADYMTPQSEIRLFNNCDKGQVVEHEAEVTNLFSEHMETSMN